MSIYDDMLGAEEQSDKYDRLLAQDADAQRTQVVGSLALGSRVEPNRRAKVIDIATRERLPVDTVDRNLERLQRPRVDYDKLISDTPRLAEWLGDPENASVAHDDLPSLSTWEWLGKAPKTGLQQGSAVVELGQLGTRAARAIWGGQPGLSDAEEARISELEALSARETGADTFWSKAYVGAFKVAPQIGTALLRGTKYGMGVSVTAGSAAALAGPGAPITVPVAAGAGFTAGAVAGSFQASQEMETGNAFLEFRAIRDAEDKPIDPRIAAIAADAVGVANGLIELGGLGVLVKSFPGGSKVLSGFTREAVKNVLARPSVLAALGKLSLRFGGVWTAEVSQEVAQEAMTILAGEIAKGAAEGEFEEVTGEQVGGRLAETAVSAAQEFAIISFLGPGSRFVGDANSARKAGQTQKVFEALGSEESKLRTRLPEKFKEFVAKATEGGPVETVYIPADKFVSYFQEANIDPDTVLKQMPAVAAQLEERLASGGDLAIPMSDFATYIAGSQHFEGLSQDLRFNPEDMTANEATAWEAQAETLGKELRKAAETKGPPNQAIYENVLEQLVGTGMERGTAERNATLMASVFRTLGERSGQDPKALYERYGLRIGRDLPVVPMAFVEPDTMLPEEQMILPPEKVVGTPSSAKLGPAPAAPQPEAGDAAPQIGGLEPIESIMDAERRLSAGGRIFAVDEMEEEPFEITSVDDLRGYTADQLYAAPQAEAQPEAPAETAVGARWTLDPGANPGEPSRFLDGETKEDATAALVEVPIEGTDNSAYEAIVIRDDGEPQSVGLFDTAQDAAAAAEAQAPPPATPPPAMPAAKPAKGIEGASSRVRIGDRYVSVRWAVMDAAELAPTFDKAENQYRDRNRAAAQAQVRGIAANIDFNLLGDSPLMDYGAPTLAPDGRVVGGNGRLAAIRLAYQSGRGDAYRVPLVEQAQRFGLSQDEVTGIAQPVLVRILTEDVDVAEAAMASNEGGALRMSALEQAKVDAERIGDLSEFEVTEDGQLSIPGSRAAIRQWVGKQPATQRGALTDANGQISAEGLQRLRNALLYRAYGDTPTLARLVEAVDPGSRNIAAALMRVATRVGELRDAIEAGERYPLDLSNDLQVAVEKLSRIRESGQSVDEALRQGGLFDEGLNPEALALVKFLGDNLRSSRAIAGFLDRYLDAAEQAGSPKQGDLLGKVKPPTRLKLIERAAKGAAPEVDLFSLAPSQTGMAGTLFQAPVVKAPQEYIDEMEQAPDLAPEFREIETRFANWIKEDPERAMAEYAKLDEADGGKIINTDTARELSPDYRANRTLSAAVHEPASALVKAMYARALAQQAGEDAMVLFSAGGTGAGKSSGLKKLLSDEVRLADIIFDTNMNGYQSARQKIDQAHATGRTTLIVYTYRNVFEALRDGALSRAARQEARLGSGRAVPVDEHLNTHFGSSETIAQLVAEYAENEQVQFLFVNNSLGKNNAELADLAALPQLSRLEYSNVREQAIQIIEDERRAGRVSETISAAFLRSAVSPRRPQVGPGDRGQLEQERAARGGREARPAELSADDLAAFAGQVLFQSFADAQRGATTFGVDRKFTISLLEKADLSTFLHEGGHFYFEVLGDLAADPAASDQVRGDYSTLLKWMGVEKREDVTVAHHEQFARGFEAYLFGGKAPSVELQNVFARFRAWLVSIYRTITKLDVTLSDEVRGVMDRLVATDDEIRAAQESQNYVALFATADAAGYSPQEFAAYRGAVEKARIEAEERLTQQVLAELTREQRAWWKEEREKVRGEVEAEAHANPVYRALSFLQRGTAPDGTALGGVDPVKLNRAALVARYGQEFLKRLPRPYVYAKEGGVAPDVVALMFGFDSGDAMIQALVNARPMKQAIEAATDDRMRTTHGDMLTDGSLAEQAMLAVHNDRRAELLAAELKALRRLEREVKPALRARELATAREQREARVANAAMLPNVDERRLISRAAEQAVAGRKIKELNPNQYRIAEAKASRLAFEAAAKGDYQTAYFEKRKQLLNHELYRAASAAREDVDKTVEYLRSFDKPRKRAALGKAGADYLEQIDSIRERFDFRYVTGPAIQKRLALAEFIAEQRAAGMEINLPQALVDESRRMPYRELTYGELQGVRDVVVNIDHLSRLKNKLLARKDQAEFDAVVGDVVTSIDGNHVRTPPPFEFAPSFGDSIVRGKARLMAEHTKMEFLFTWLDGEKDLGPVWQALFKPLADAESAEQTMHRDARIALHEIFGAYTPAERWAMYHQKALVPEIGKSFNKASLMAVALNVGNQYNRDVLLRGYKWSEAQLRALLTRLDERDWATVQKLWDFIDGYWPAIKALQKDLTGLEPPKVEAVAFTAPTGQQMRGGYYPIVYDSRLSWRQQALDEEQAANELYGGAYTRVATQHGHTVARTNSGGKAIRLDLGVAMSHVVNVVHDLTHRRALLDVDRLVTNDRVRMAIEETAGREMYAQLRPWLKSIAADFRGNMTAVEGMLNHLRGGATVVAMGLKLTTAVVQPLGYFQSLELLGAKYAAIGLREMYAKGDPIRSIIRAREFAFERSEQMRGRMTTFDRDVRDQFKKMTETEYSSNVRRGFFFLIGLMDMSTSMPTWLGAYRKAMDGAVDGLTAGDEKAAIDFADSILRRSQSAGGAKDLAGVQAKHPLLKLFTTFYSYFSVLFNLLERRRKLTGPIKTLWTRPRDMGRFVASMLTLWFIPAVLSEIVAGRGPDDDEPFEDYLKRTAALWALYPLQSVVFVRDVANALAPWGYDGPPALDAVEQTANTLALPAKMLDEDAELSRADLKAVLLAASYWGHLPGRQMWITGSYLYDWMTGDEDPETVAEVAEGIAFSRKPQ